MMLSPTPRQRCLRALVDEGHFFALQQLANADDAQRQHDEDLGAAAVHVLRWLGRLVAEPPPTPCRCLNLSVRELSRQGRQDQLQDVLIPGAMWKVDSVSCKLPMQWQSANVFESPWSPRADFCVWECWTVNS